MRVIQIVLIKQLGMNLSPALPDNQIPPWECSSFLYQALRGTLINQISSTGDKPTWWNKGLKTPLFQYEELLREKENIYLEKMSHFYDSHLVDDSFFKRYFFFHLVKNDEGWMPFLLVRKLHFLNQSNCGTFPTGSKCPKLDSDLPCCRTYPLSACQPSLICKGSLVCPSHSQIFKCTTLPALLVLLILQNFPHCPPDPFFMTHSSDLPG